MTADSDNPLVLNVLHASSTAYSFNPDKNIEDVVSKLLILFLKIPYPKQISGGNPV
jgi:hypothetical protein